MIGAAGFITLQRFLYQENYIQLLYEIAGKERMRDFCLFPQGDGTEVACFQHRTSMPNHILYYMTRNVHAVNKIAECVTRKIECHTTAFTQIMSLIIFSKCFI